MKYLELTYELKSLIENDPRYLLLKEKERAMEENEEVMALSYQKDMREIELSDALRHFDDSSAEVNKAKVALFRASSTLDEHPVVKEYLDAYQEFKKILDEVNGILFGDLKRKKCQ